MALDYHRVLLQLDLGHVRLYLALAQMFNSDSLCYSEGLTVAPSSHVVHCLGGQGILALGSLCGTCTNSAW